MAVRLNQPSRVREEGPTGCKPLWCGSKEGLVSPGESTARTSIG